jgi:uncharacterized membrane protein
MTAEGRTATSGPPRLFGVDAARGLALIGMFVAHTVVTADEMIVDGRSAILFATVAGVSLGLSSGGARPPDPGDRTRPRLAVLIRGGMLVLLGLTLTVLLRPPIAVILDYYGIAFVLLVGLLFANRLALVALGAVITLAAPPLVTLITEVAPYEDLAEPLQIVGRWFVYGEYPMLVWIAYLLAGLVLARSDLRDRFTACVALVGGTVAAGLGYGAAALVPGLTAAAHSDSSLEVLASGGVAVGIIGALSLLDSATSAGERAARVIRCALAPLAAAGAMALTLYVAHAVVLAIIAGSASDGRSQMPGWALPVFVGGSLVIAPLWRRFVGPGPLEAVLRTITRLTLRRREI